VFGFSKATAEQHGKQFAKVNSSRAAFQESLIPEIATQQSIFGVHQEPWEYHVPSGKLT